ncbi:MAG: SDR family NAD(P)-dependent oxidoreductase [Desulfobacter sp.]|nr:MAG: SDR family NAD(P)-dependent oxidoreductase [Desulfobacter sp.]
MTPQQKSHIGHPVAVIGMGCIFPESRNLKEYWRLLFNGKDAIKPIPEETHWRLKDYYDEDPACPDHTYCTQGGFIPEIAFDPLSYGIPPNNIEATDTSQLLGLEVARMALADAGYPVGHEALHRQKVNVILGVTGTQELVIPLGARLGHPLWKKAMIDGGLAPEKTDEILQRLDRSYTQWQENSFPGLLGNVVAGRIANRLDLSGTNAVSDAACASSLSAIHTAVMELQTGRCDMSITGGVDTLNDIFMHMCFSKTGVLSHSSDAKPFSKDADGTVLGEGVGMLVLKRLCDAERDNDRIYAVIRGIGTSSDGKTSAVYAPEAKGQVRALKDAYERAGVDPGSVGLIEAHGTGTRVGDKVEFTALKKYFGNDAGAGATAIGSVKSMIGHSKAAAGAAGMIKTILALHHKVIPPTLKAAEPDPELEINGSSFYLNDRSKPWVKKNDTLRRSGVSAFGFGGSNFHAVLEEYGPEKPHVSWDGSVQILAVSAPDKKGLTEKLNHMRETLAAYDPKDVPEYTQAVAWQAFESRQRFSVKDPFRILILITGDDDATNLIGKSLDTVNNGTAATPPVFYGTGTPQGKLGFVFPGQGSQYTGMARDIISIFPEAMDAFNLGQDCLGAEHRDSDLESLSRYTFPLPGHAIGKKEAEEKLRQTHIAQPAIGAATLAMLEILNRFGISPEMTCGHSFGELSALCAAGWLDKKDFLKLAAARGRYMADAGKTGDDPGSMLAIQAPVEKIQALLDNSGLDLVLANKNSPAQGVLSGSTMDIDKAHKLCKKQKMRAVKLPVAAAFHSRLVENAARPFSKDVAQITLAPTAVAVLSNTTGQVYPKAPKKAGTLLGNQLMHPVNFTDNIEFMHKNGISTFLEIGPKSVLTGLIKTILKGENIQACALDASAGKKTGIFDLAAALCAIAARGHDVDLTPWEEPAQAPVPKKMKLMISGANPKPTREQLPPAAPAVKPLAPAAHQIPAEPGPATPMEKQAPLSSSTQADRAHNTNYSQNRGRIMTPSTQTTSQPVSNQPASPQTAPATGSQMDILTRGLEAIQQLQAQTARAHEKFLETQAMAGQSLAMMLEQTRSGAAPAPAYTAPMPVVPAPEIPAPKPAETPAPQPVYTAPETPAPAPSTQTPAQPAPVQKAAPHGEDASAPAQTQNTGIQSILFETVSKLTGFPVEMLEPEMDIESDLGIDSIKKVEIISELEKQMPGGQSVSPDHLTTVRTLEDICRAMGDTDAHSGSIQPAPEPVASPSQAGGTQDSEQTFNVLVGIISELTGFPREMLEPEMNLESDLGIDSIKRVEILSKLEQELPDVGTVSPDEMGTLKSLDDIVRYLSPDTQENTEPEGAAQPSKKKTSLESVTGSETDETVPESPSAPLLRQEIGLTPYPTNQIRFYNGTRIQVSNNRTVYLTRDGAGIAQCFKKEFVKAGIKAELIDPGKSPAPDLPDAAGLVIIAEAFSSSDNQAAKSFLSSAFDLVRTNAGYIGAAAKEKGGFLTTVSFGGGAFGFDAAAPAGSPVYGGLAGLAKTADLEWPDVLCHALDLPSDADTAKSYAEAAVALMMTHGAVEMGLQGDQCVIPTLESKPIPLAAEKAVPPEFGTEDVAVITGGAKGVTAECALALARASHPNIVLLGRSPAPFAEPEWIANLTEPGEMKKAILANAFPGEKPKPAAVESEYRRLVSNRDIRKNIDRIAAHAAQVRYHSVDIRDKDQVAGVLADVQAELGPVTALVHGAGVLEDKLIAEKSMEQFTRVFNTKIEGLESLVEAVDVERLKYLVLFSSIAGRLGNQGQCDYAMANEVLNKTAQAMAVSHPRCRVLSLNWGPWDGGMVNDALKKEFSRRGVAMIPLAAGAAQMIMEMANPDHTAVEVVIGGTMNPSPQKKKPVLNRALSQNLGVKASPIVNDHKIDNKPVVPFALMADLMACGTEKNNPGLRFTGIDNLRLLKGITLGGDDIAVHVNVGKCLRRDGLFTAPATLASENISGEAAIHAEAELILSDTLPEPPVLSQAAFMDLKPCEITPARAYDEILFHREGLQSIIDISGISPKGMEVTARTAPEPGAWYDAPHTREWSVDPLMLDTAFQTAILWTHETRNQVCLPAFFANLRLYKSYPSRSGNIRVLFTVNNETRHKVQGYFTFLDETDTVIASIMGFEAFIDPGLKTKFKPAPLFNRDRILAFAQGDPSEAFGEAYKAFDKKREIARLPRPPYFFMDSVTVADHKAWEMAPGGWIETTYEIPETEWYFTANRSKAMPFCILLEIALQPCGWLAAYAGSALKSQERLHFRNLGGDATLVANPTSESGTLTIRVRMSDVSQAGGMIIQDFEMEVQNRGNLIYKGTTNFGFFTADALANQVGIRTPRFYQKLHGNAQAISFENDAPVTPDDTSVSPDTGMPSKALRMIDTIDHLDIEGGIHGRGLVQAVKTVDPQEWFFKAHFYQDPVCPGSLGVESFLQMLRFFLVKKYSINPAKYKAAMAENNRHKWIYRGQIIPANKNILIQAHIKECSDENGRYTIVADGALMVDGICIYEMEDFSMAFVPAEEKTAVDEQLENAEQN